MFEARWRWNATIALAVQRMRNGQKLPPQWQRNQAEDLVAVVFPDQLACLENIRGEREVPDHPLVRQTIGDCLTETMDIDGLEALLQRLEAGDIGIRCLDLTGPSPLAAEIINARPYAFLDDGEAENRRTRAIRQNANDLADAATLSIITVEATEQVRAEAWIRPRNPDELHDGLLQLGFLTEAEFGSGTSSGGAAGTADNWERWFRSLTDELRASCVEAGGRHWWVATERLGEFQAMHPDALPKPDPAVAFKVVVPDRELAIAELLRSRLSGLGPVTVATLMDDFGLRLDDLQPALLRLQNEGYAMAMGGKAATSELDKTWCERRLLARIHRYSRERRRRAAQPVAPAAYMRFLLEWHGFGAPAGEMEQALAQLEGWVAPVAAWEQGLLATRCSDYSSARLDEQFLSGYLTWFRPDRAGAAAQQLVASTPIAVVPRSRLPFWYSAAEPEPSRLSGRARHIWEALLQGGAMFTPDLAQYTGLMQTELEQGLAELVAQGMVSADAWSPLRWLIRPEAEKHRVQKRLSRRRRGFSGNGSAGLLGRWSVVNPELRAGAANGGEEELFADQARQAAICESLLLRYGVVFRAVLERESLIPPWRTLLFYLRRMEDRGEVHGGRFVDGFSGEQFALPEAVGLLRNVSKARAERRLAVVNAADPLNLGGIITPGARTPARPGNRILLLNGVPAARILGDEVEILASGTELTAAEAERHLRSVRRFPDKVHAGDSQSGDNRA